MRGFNKVIIAGHLGDKVDFKTKNDDFCVANFSIATNESWLDKDGNKETLVDWHRVTIFGKLAINCKDYLSKGSKVLVEGKLRTKSFTDKNDVEKYSTFVIAKKVIFLDSKSDEGVIPDDVPFDVIE